MQFVWSLPSPSTPHPPIAPPRPATCTRCLPSLPSVYSLPPFPPVCVLSLYLTEFFLDLNFLSTARWRIFFTLHHLYPYSLFSPPPPLTCLLPHQSSHHEFIHPENYFAYRHWDIHNPLFNIIPKALHWYQHPSTSSLTLSSDFDPSHLLPSLPYPPHEDLFYSSVLKSSSGYLKQHPVTPETVPILLDHWY